MLIGITGHTSGIGKLIANHFEVIGFSRSNGYDLTKDATIEKLLYDLNKCDVFINNAFPYVKESDYKYMHLQTEILYKVYNQWVDKSKLIINIGSNTTDGIKKKIWPYSAAKESLEKANEQLCYLNNSCSVSMLKLGYVDTERITNAFPNEKKILQSEVIDSIDFILQRWKNNTKVKEICLIP